MKFEKLLITPELAKELLEKNTSNRTLSKRAVKQYALDMAQDSWREDTGETIKIAKDGTVLDGQHRLQAIILADKSVTLHVATGIDNAVMSVIDTGKKRSSCDILHINGAKNSTALSGAINKYLYIGSGSKGARSNNVLTNQMTFDEYKKREKVWDRILENACRWYIKFNKVIPASIIGGWYAYFYDINQEDAFKFFEQLCTGNDIKNNTINVLRNAFMKDKLSTSSKMVEEKRSAIIMKAWNAYRKGTTLQQLDYRPAYDNKLKAE